MKNDDDGPPLPPGRVEPKPKVVPPPHKGDGTPQRTADDDDNKGHGTPQRTEDDNSAPSSSSGANYVRVISTWSVRSFGDREREIAEQQLEYINMNAEDYDVLVGWYKA